MSNLEDNFESLIAIENLEEYETEDAIQHLGSLIDLSYDLKKIEGLEKAIEMSGVLFGRDLTSRQLSILHYYLGNAWGDLLILRKRSTDQLWDYQQEEIGNEIINLRKALSAKGFAELSDNEKCQILTNLGNSMDYIGRFVEAIEYWDDALKIDSSFSMAHGNRGEGFVNYAQALYDDGHTICPREIFLRLAYSELKLGLSRELHEDARKHFDNYKDRIEGLLSPESLKKEIEMNEFSLGDSKTERYYRKWCLEKRVFLNPLNDLGPHPIAAEDNLAPPGIVVKIRKETDYMGYFNQLKQEFVSARYLYYEGIKSEEPHFSDKGVRLFNTLDYPAYSLAVEKIKMAFRVTYSIFDKIAYFLNNYLELNINEKKINFKTLWFVSQEKKKGLRAEFKRNTNWPLRGLFWLSKDLYEDESAFREAILPEAQEIYEIRNNLEHRYLKIHNEMLSSPRRSASRFKYSIYRHDFEAKTLRLVKTARAALIYLFTAVSYEENLRAKERSGKKSVVRLPLSRFDDRWKI